MWTHPYLRMEGENPHLNHQHSHSWKALQFALAFKLLLLEMFFWFTFNLQHISSTQRYEFSTIKEHREKTPRAQVKIVITILLMKNKAPSQLKNHSHTDPAIALCPVKSWLDNFCSPQISFVYYALRWMTSRKRIQDVFSHSANMKIPGIRTHQGCISYGAWADNYIRPSASCYTRAQG